MSLNQLYPRISPEELAARERASRSYKVTDIDRFRQEHNERVHEGWQARARRMQQRRMLQVVHSDQAAGSPSPGYPFLQKALSMFTGSNLSKTFKAMAFRLELGRLKIEFVSMKQKGQGQ